MVVGFLDLAQGSETVMAVLREPWHDLETASDDRGTAWMSKGGARLPNNPYLYQRLAPAPLAGARLSVTIEKI